MNASTIPADDAGGDQQQDATLAVAAENVELREELERMRNAGRITGEFYLNRLAKATTPEAVLQLTAEMVQAYYMGHGLIGDSRRIWIEVLDNEFGIARGALSGEPPRDAVEAAKSRYKSGKRETFATTADDGVRHAIVPVPAKLGADRAIALLGIEITKTELAANTRTIADSTALASALHIERMDSLRRSARNEQYARASARAQLRLSAPHQLDEALRQAIDALSECDDLIGGAALTLGGAGADIVTGVGDFSDDEMIALAVPDHGRSATTLDGKSVLPIVVDDREIAAIVLHCQSGINAHDDEMLGSIARAVASSVARFHAAATIESLRQSATRQLVEAQERERSMIAADIHDGVLQQLGATAIRLELAQARVHQNDFEAASSIIEDGAKEIRSCARELRALLMELRPQVLDDNGLSAALSELAHQVDGVNVEVHTDLPESLGNEYSITVFRIVQEALTNVQKHAEASNASVSAVAHNDELTLEIRDDGIGFEAATTGPSSEGSHLGLLGMRERARMMGGQFSITGGSGNGSQITVRLPLVRNTEGGQRTDVVGHDGDDSAM